MEKVSKYVERENHRLLGDAIEKRFELYRKVIESDNGTNREGSKALLFEIINLQKMQVLCDDLEEVDAKRVVDSLTETEVSELRERFGSETSSQEKLKRLDRLLANRPYPQEKIIKTSVIGNI
jgi:hypothetical protein